LTTNTLKATATTTVTQEKVENTMTVNEVTATVLENEERFDFHPYLIFHIFKFYENCFFENLQKMLISKIVNVFN
jgi:hypothetical protein